MAKFPRTKLLTDTGYSPTLAISEATRRSEVDGSIQEIQDILYSQDAGKGASQIGMSGMSYQNVQELGEAFVLSGSGSLPPSDSIITEMVQDEAITNDKLATDVKVGSLASSTTTDKSSVIAVTNEILTTVSTNEAKRRKFVSLSDLNKVDATLTDVPDISIDVEVGKTYKIETFGKYKVTINTTGIKFGHYLTSGAGITYGEIAIHLGIIVTSSNISRISISAIGASGLTGSFITTSGVDPINTDLFLYSSFLFKCTSAGVLKHQFASEVAAASTLLSGVTTLVTEV